MKKTGEKQGDTSGISRKYFHTADGWHRRIKDMTSTGFLLRTNIGYFIHQIPHTNLSNLSRQEFIGCRATSESDQVPSYAAELVKQYNNSVKVAGGGCNCWKCY